MKFQRGDQIRYTNGVTGEVRTGIVLKSAPLKNWRGKITEPEVLSIIWDDNGSVDHSWLPTGVEKVGQDE